MQNAKETASTEETLRELEQKCSQCHPLSPLACVTNCSTWKLKNEYRKNFEKMKTPEFKLDLLNTLKNRRRIQILGTVLRCRCRLDKLQNEMRRLGYRHSQETLLKEYLAPLMNTGLIQKEQEQYYATTFGSQIYGIMGGLNEFECVLPPHSECHEEQVLHMLVQGPKPLAELQTVIPSKSVGRVLHRLQKTGLVETEPEKDYVFFFKTQRDPNKEVLSPTERKVHSSILESGISARKLAENVQISLRRIYKYVRRLKGKKLVFIRIRTRTYLLTMNGVHLAEALENIQSLVEEMLNAGEQLNRNGGVFDVGMSRTPSVTLKDRESALFRLSTVQFAQKRNIKNH
jgi:predicted transcriptional regulator